MPSRWSIRFSWYEHAALARYVAVWLLIAVPLGVVVGTAVAAFLWSLDRMTVLRQGHPWLLWTLPFLGLAVGAVYQRFAGRSAAGNNLIIDEIHTPGGGVPLRMTPLVLLGTLLTHLGGGSAGREGTAVQVGGSLAGEIGRRLRLSEASTRTLLTAGIAAGFGAVFGTPVTGAVFALEVLAIGRLSYAALWPCLIGSVVGDRVCSAWDVQWLSLHFQVRHTHYGLAAFDAASSGVQPVLLAKVVVAAALFGLAGLLFAELTHGLGDLFKRTVRWPLLRPVVGGLAVIGLTYALGTRDYLGLGVTADPHSPTGVCILSCFRPGGATPWSWWWKLLFTAVTLGSGFKGGEVTPLFFVGAALGHTLAGVLGAPVDLFAALGFVAVFAGATNTPLACTIMGIELFAAGGTLGAGLVVYLAVACGVAYLFSGHSGVYLSQRVEVAKHSAADVPTPRTLRDWHGPV